jgi:hypothetical protein
MIAQWHLKLLSGTVLIWVGLMISPGLVRGQGGTGRDPGPASTPRARPTEPTPTRHSRPSNATGSSTPTPSEAAKLKEALQFVHDTVAAHPSDDFPKTFAQLNGCSVEIAWLAAPGHGNPGPDRDHLALFSLADINPENIVVKDYDPSHSTDIHATDITLHTTSSRNRIRDVSDGTDPRFPASDTLTSSASIGVYDLDTANHVVNALKRAIGSCGGKPDPF